MADQRSDIPSLRGTETRTPGDSRARKPFVQPSVQDLGGLKQLTLVGGSTP
jgi:hypothetical protein